MHYSMCMFDNKNQALFLQYGNCGLLALEPTFIALSLCACIFSDLFITSDIHASKRVGYMLVVCI